MSVEESLKTQLQNFLQSGQWERAKDVLYELLAEQPQSAWLHYRVGSVLAQLDDHTNAEIHLKAAIANEPSFTDAYQELGQLYLDMGRTGQADDYVKTALSLAPNDPNSLILATYIALSYDDITKAQQHLSHLERELPDSASLNSVRNSVLNHPKNKNKPDPSKQLEAHLATLKKDPEFCFAHYEIALLHLYETKDYNSAQEHIKNALYISPTDKSYQQIYAKIIRKKNPLMNVLSWPLSFYDSNNPQKDSDYTYILMIIGIVVIAIIGAMVPESIKPIYKLSVLAIVCSFFIFYPVVKLYEYLTLTELYHEMKKINLFRGPFKKLHKLPYSTRLIIFSALTITFWAILAFLIITYLPL